MLNLNATSQFKKDRRRCIKRGYDMIRASKALFSKAGVLNSIEYREIRPFRNENVPDFNRISAGIPF